MNSSNILIVRPVDLSISFLETIFEGLNDFKSIIIEPNDKSYANGIKHINEMPNSSTIIFLGHGSSNCLYGAHNLSYERKPLVQNSNISILKNKSIFSLSCRSSEFLYKNRSVIKNFIGFNYLPTDWDDIVAERDLGDPNYLLNIREEDIVYYKNTLAKMVLSSFIKNKKSIADFERIFLYIKLMVNKEISKILVEKPMPNYRLLADIWYVTKQGMIFFNGDND